MKAGWVEILVIALFIFWLINANRKRRILQKMEDSLDAKNRRRPDKKSTKSKKENLDKYREVEDIDYVEVKD